MSTTIIAAMELKYPDREEKKNEVCKPIPYPCYPEDKFLAIRNRDYPFILIFYIQSVLEKNAC